MLFFSKPTLELKRAMNLSKGQSQCEDYASIISIKFVGIVNFLEKRIKSVMKHERNIITIILF